MNRIFYSLSCLFLSTIAFSQNNTTINYGNGLTGDISFYDDYKPYITDNLVPFAYNILHQKLPKYSVVELSGAKNSYTIKSTPKIFWDADFHIQTIKEKNTNYTIKQLFKKYTDYNESYPVTLLEIDEFTISTHKYIVVQTAYDCNINAINALTFTFAFEIVGDNLKYIPFKSSAHSSILCYGDFDNDGNLDYLDLKDCDVKMYSYKNNKAAVNNNYYLKLDCRLLTPEVELIFINLSQSKWTYDLKKAWDRLKQ